MTITTSSFRPSNPILEVAKQALRRLGFHEAGDRAPALNDQLCTTSAVDQPQADPLRTPDLGSTTLQAFGGQGEFTQSLFII